MTSNNISSSVSYYCVIFDVNTSNDSSLTIAVLHNFVMMKLINIFSACQTQLSDAVSRWEGFTDCCGILAKHECDYYSPKSGEVKMTWRMKIKLITKILSFSLFEFYLFIDSLASTCEIYFFLLAA